MWPVKYVDTPPSHCIRDVSLYIDHFKDICDSFDSIPNIKVTGPCEIYVGGQLLFKSSTTPMVFTHSEILPCVCVLQYPEDLSDFLVINSYCVYIQPQPVSRFTALYIASINCYDITISTNAALRITNANNMRVNNVDAIVIESVNYLTLVGNATVTWEEGVDCVMTLEDSASPQSHHRIIETICHYYDYNRWPSTYIIPDKLHIQAWDQISAFTIPEIPWLKISLYCNYSEQGNYSLDYVLKLILQHQVLKTLIVSDIEFPCEIIGDTSCIKTLDRHNKVKSNTLLPDSICVYRVTEIDYLTSPLSNIVNLSPITYRRL